MLILYAKSENSTPINENFNNFGSHFEKWPLRPNRAKSRMAPLLILISMMNIICVPNFMSLSHSEVGEKNLVPPGFEPRTPQLSRLWVEIGTWEFHQKL